ncbi:hypothetical protein ACPZ55_04745 [Klebsiella pneumoniae]
MKSANNKLTIIADVLLLLLFAAVLGFIIWRFGDLFGLTGDKNKFYIWLAGIMSFIFCGHPGIFPVYTGFAGNGGSLRNRGNTRKKKFVMNLGKEHLCILNYFFIFATVTVCSGSVRSVCCW